VYQWVMDRLRITDTNAPGPPAFQHKVLMNLDLALDLKRPTDFIEEANEEPRIWWAIHELSLPPL
jgi:hypothetical protein